MRELPGRPDLDHLRRQAGALRRAAAAGDPAARRRLEAVSAPPTLTGAQFALAREHDLIGQDDDLVLKRATELGRVLVTDNVRHILPIHERRLQEPEAHAGLLLAHPRRYPRSKRTIGLWVRGVDQVLRAHGTGSTENLCAWLP